MQLAVKLDKEVLNNLNIQRIDYTLWQQTLWLDETVESLSDKAQKAWDDALVDELTRTHYEI